jgi:hypothetical protein
MNIDSHIELEVYPRRIYSQNRVNFDSPIWRTLPIGLENLRLGRSGFKFLHKGITEFSILDKVLIPPMSPTNPTRILVSELCSELEIFEVRSEYLSRNEYFNLVRRYKFVLVCEGNGYDTHRLWEVLYQNSIPIVIRTPWIDSLSWMNLPLLVVDHVQDIDRQLLETTLSRHQNLNSKHIPALWIDFWEEEFRGSYEESLVE